MNIRDKNWGYARDKIFDVAIIGGGINGASIFKNLCHKGYKVILIDKGDFSCGTSQSSAMMIWGGLLYLRNLDIKAVYQLSKNRDAMLRSFPKQITTRVFRYIPSYKNGRSRSLVYLALQLYWILGGFKRIRPSYEKRFVESEFLKNGNKMGSLFYEEGFLKHSDSQFVLHWITGHQSQNTLSLNYCIIENGEYSDRDKWWAFKLRDRMGLNRIDIKAKLVLNCAGVWTDKVNTKFNIQSPYKHVFSKGVFIGFKRPVNHYVPLFFEMEEHGDVLGLIPWGPISLWGPTETVAQSIEEGFSIFPEDIHFLLKHAQKNFILNFANSPITTLRCGLRPLVVKSDFYSNIYPLEISRRHKIVKDVKFPWISIYGGKISGCLSLAEEVTRIVIKNLGFPSGHGPNAPNPTERDYSGLFPGLDEKMPTIDWCIENEFCCTLEDYLRRRTNISQWVAREGLGFNNENLSHLAGLASKLPTKYLEAYPKPVEEYLNNVTKRFDKVIKTI